MLRNNRLLVLFVTLMVSVIVLGIGLSGATPPARASGISAPLIVTPTVNPKVNAKYVNNLQAAKTPVANNLLPLGANGKFPLAVIPQGTGSGLDADKLDGLDSAALQKRVTGSCAAGNAIRAVNANGAVGCQATGGIALPFKGTGSDGNALFQISNDKGDGVMGRSTDQFGVSGYTTDGTGVYGDNGNSNTNGHAGYFAGRVHVTKGLVVDGNLSAKNLPGVTFSQGTTGQMIQNQTKEVDSIVVAVPATGYLMITGSLEVQARAGGFSLEYALFDVTNGNNRLTQITNTEIIGYGNPSRTLQLSWVVPVAAGQYTFKTFLTEYSNNLNQWYEHSLIAMYFPVQY